MKSIKREEKVNIIVREAMFSAILFISQIIMASIPNGEIVTLLIILISINYGVEVFIAIFVFNVLEAILYGINIWVLMYFIVWPLIATCSFLLRRVLNNKIVVSLYSLLCGATFGLICSLVYIPISIEFAIEYFISGIPFDLMHAGFNFMLSMILYEPLNRVFRELRSNSL